MRDHVLLLAILVAEDFIRAHTGTGYFYSPIIGFWDIYGGLFPDVYLPRIKDKHDADGRYVSLS